MKPSRRGPFRPSHEAGPENVASKFEYSEACGQVVAGYDNDGKVENREVKMDASIQQQLLKIVEKINRAGTFCTNGPLPSIVPGLEVASIGPLALPLEKRQAAALKKRARQAPYGKGTQTLVDTAVRQVWEVDADQLELANPHWSDVVSQAVAAAQTDLGLEKQQLEAHLYKLLLYEPDMREGAVGPFRQHFE